MTRVRAPDKEDWEKLVHLMRYIRGTRDPPLILNTNGSGILKWYVDAPLAVHPNMRGNSGGGLSLGHGFPIVSSIEQRLNGRSLTETEIIGSDDFMPAICWTSYFLEAQGYGINDNILFQDNKVLFFCRRMERLRAANIRNTSTFVISLYQIMLDREKCQ